MTENGDHLDIVIKKVFEGMKKLTPRPGSCPDEEMLAAYYDGSLKGTETEKTEAHLVVCEECTEKLIMLSESEASYTVAEDALPTEEMVQRAKDLIQPPLAKISIGERIVEWFATFRPIPAFATVSVLALLAISIATLYSPGDPNRMQPGAISFGIIASMPSGDLTRSKEPLYKEIELQEGAILQSRDRFRIKFQLREAAYAYLLSYNSQGHVTTILPEKPVSSGFKAEAGVAYLVPSGDKWFQLDENIGIEKLYLLVSSKPIDGIREKIEELSRSGIEMIANIFPKATVQAFSFRHE